MFKLSTMATVGGAALTYHMAYAGLHPIDHHDQAAHEPEVEHKEAPQVDPSLQEGADVGNGRRVMKTKTMITKEAKKMRKAQVKDKNCSRLCIFENDNNSWCFATTPPMVVIGWDWDNQFSLSNNTYNSSYEQVKFYNWVLSPYTEIQAYLQSLYDIEMLFYNEFSASLRKFKANTWFSVIINGNFQICGGFGYATQIIELELILALKFIDCYKTFLQDLCDFTTTWTGYEAKWLDECD